MTKSEYYHHSRKHSHSRSERYHSCVKSSSSCSSSSSKSSKDSKRSSKRRSRSKRSSSLVKSDKKYDKSHKKSSRSNRHDSKKDKKHKKKTSENKIQWGKYGVIKPSDMWLKKAEFHLWLLEVKNTSYEEISSYEEKNLFKDFMEDYNTATFPHKKYYDLRKWERKQLLKKEKHGHSSNSMGSTVLFNDEDNRRKEISNLRHQVKEDKILVELNSIKQDKEKVQAMKEQQNLKNQMRSLFQSGRIEEARKIANLLKPDN